jgi:hypothetical protein
LFLIFNSEDEKEEIEKIEIPQVFPLPELPLKDKSSKFSQIHFSIIKYFLQQFENISDFPFYYPYHQ